jgi:hypothetical protein
MSFDLSNYTTVNDRLLELFKRFPEARIQNTPPAVVQFNGREWWIVTTTIWRNPEDQIPCIASAVEPVGTTAYTRDSEAMNAETSSIGRCVLLIGGIGITAGGSMASRNEVQNRQGGAPTPNSPDHVGASPASPRTFPNKWAKPCVRCGFKVPEGAGVTWKEGEFYKTAHHDGQCETEEEPF